MWLTSKFVAVKLFLRCYVTLLCIDSQLKFCWSWAAALLKSSQNVRNQSKKKMIIIIEVIQEQPWVDHSEVNLSRRWGPHKHDTTQTVWHEQLFKTQYLILSHNLLEKRPKPITRRKAQNHADISDQVKSERFMSMTHVERSTHAKPQSPTLTI